jgi:Response regulator containing CheY-like receiver, AAA-type ATPase, and DNA-binding domains
MKILIVEDNKNKLLRLKEYILEMKVEKELNIVEAKSFTSGIRRIIERCWDVIILDMSLPTYDITHRENGGDKKPVAGKEIMKRMIHKNILIPVIIVTQFETFGENKITLDILNEEFEKNFKQVWKGTIFYEGDKWQRDLNLILREIIKKEGEK